MSDQEQIAASIVTNATSAKVIAVEGESVTQQDIDSQIKAAKFLQSQAAVNGASGGMSCRRQRFPGASGLHS